MMTRFAAALLLAPALLASSAVAWNDGPQLRRLLNEHSFNGVALVAEGEQIVFRDAFGFERFEPPIRGSMQTAYEIASVSKPFTAIAVLMLEERGALSLSDPLTKYFPRLPYPGVTLERMLSHTSGLYDVCCQAELRRRFDTFYGKPDVPYSNKDYLAFIEKETPPLAAQPGEQFQYSNLGYVLLALIVEKVSGMQFDAFLADNIFRPAGMTRTYLLSKMHGPIVDFAAGYRRAADGNAVLDEPVSTPQYRSVLAATYGDDEIVSTADDLFAFGRALVSGKLLKARTLQRAWTPAVLRSGEPAPYGLGFRIDRRSDGRTLVLHTGGTYGFLATLTFPTTKEDATAILLTNVRTGDMGKLRSAVFDLVWPVDPY